MPALILVTCSLKARQQGPSKCQKVVETMLVEVVIDTRTYVSTMLSTEVLSDSDKSRLSFVRLHKSTATRIAISFPAHRLNMQSIRCARSTPSKHQQHRTKWKSHNQQMKINSLTIATSLTLVSIMRIWTRLLDATRLCASMKHGFTWVLYHYKALWKSGKFPLPNKTACIDTKIDTVQEHVKISSLFHNLDGL